MQNSWTIARREFRHYFVSPIAYAVAIFLFVVLGILFYVNVSFGMATGQIPPDGRVVMGPMVTLLLLTVPFLTMRLIAEEAGSGTIELLLTAPIRDWELVLGKWLGAIGFIGLLLAITWIYPIVLHRMTTPGIDQGVLLVAYLGLLLMMSSIVAIGVMVSAFFRNSLAAGFATLTVILRDLDNDGRSHAFIAVEPTPPGDEQREIILRAMAGRFPDARWKTYNEEKQIASFVGRRHLYIVIYEEHDVESAAPVERPTLFAV